MVIKDYSLVLSTPHLLPSSFSLLLLQPLVPSQNSNTLQQSQTHGGKTTIYLNMACWITLYLLQQETVIPC